MTRQRRRPQRRPRQRRPAPCPRQRPPQRWCPERRSSQRRPQRCRRGRQQCRRHRQHRRSGHQGSGRVGRHRRRQHHHRNWCRLLPGGRRVDARRGRNRGYSTAAPGQLRTCTACVTAFRSGTPVSPVPGCWRGWPPCWPSSPSSPWSPAAPATRPRPDATGLGTRQRRAHGRCAADGEVRAGPRAHPGHRCGLHIDAAGVAGRRDAVGAALRLPGRLVHRRADSG